MQHVAVWEDFFPIEDKITCYYEANAEYKHILDLAHFMPLRTSLLQWNISPSITNGCFTLETPERAVPQYTSLLDGNVPVYCLAVELKRLGWKGEDEFQKHVKPKRGHALLHKTFDVRECHKSHKYFQCLLTLKEIWKKNKEVHSRQPISYYQLLLNGIIDRSSHALEDNCLIPSNAQQADLRRGRGLWRAKGWADEQHML